MVFVLLPVLVGAAVMAGGAHYGDYVGAKMPQYGPDEYHDSAREHAPSSDDYFDRSREVPASPDYKYEEDLSSRVVNTMSDEDWRKSTKKLPRFQRSDLNSPLLHNSNVKMNSKFKQTLRSRSKLRNVDKNGDTNRNPMKSGRIRSNDILDKDDEFTNEDRYQDRYENDKVYSRPTSDRIVRRKARDRSISNLEVEMEDLDDDDDDEGKNEQDDSKDMDYSASEDPDAQAERSGEAHQFEIKGEDLELRPTFSNIDDDIIARLESKKLDQKKNEEYQDYYDMKRLNKIKKKITVLYRRTKARATGSTTSRRVRVWTYRSSYVLDRYATPINDEVLFRATRIRTNKIKKTRITNSTKPIKVTHARTSTVTKKMLKITAGVTKLTKNVAITTNNTNNSELSLAEKSRLSILKKAHLKESLMDKRVTIKPPVLMQVSQIMNTMVMVEPQNKGEDLESMNKLGGPTRDTPERMARAKMIMKRKLIARARSIHDLTDKWDEIICDFLDESELDDAEIKLLYKPLLLFTLILQLLYKHVNTFYAF